MNDFLLKTQEELTEQQLIAVEAAKNAISTSYSPYSKFSVGAALLLEDGRIITGSNQENMAYPSGTCAERAALFAFGSQALKEKIKILAIFARYHHQEELSTGAPCGACRQVMLEYELMQDTSYQVIFYHDNEYVIAPSAKSLLPFHFHLK